MQKQLSFIATFITGCSSWYTFYCPEEFHCANVYNGPFAVPFCVYYCCIGNLWLSGLYGDGTPCWNLQTPLIHGFTGSCLRGTCIPPKQVPVRTERPPLLPTTQIYSSICDGRYQGLGYTTNCRYICSRNRNNSRMNFKTGTPCINVTNGEALEKPGVCNEGNCVKLEHMPLGSQGWRIFRRVYNQCELKMHTGVTPLTDCNHYCQLRGQWFYGNYTENSRCRFNNTDGFCCRGTCHPFEWCQEQNPYLPPELIYFPE